MNGCVLLYTAAGSSPTSRPTPATTAGLTPTFIISEMPIACAPTYTKSTQLPLALSKKVKMCGNYGHVASVIASSRIYWLKPTAALCSWHTSQLVFLFSILGTLSSCWQFKMDSCSCTVAKGKEGSDWLKKHSAASMLKGHLFHPTNSTDSKYVTNLGLDNELMNSIFC